MTEAEALEIFARADAIVTGGHFEFANGRHSSTYVNKDAIYLHTDFVSMLCRGLAERFFMDTFLEGPIDTVVGPTIGGVVLSQWTAHHLSALTGKKVYATYAEKTNGKLEIRRDYPKFITDKRVLVVEDILTTGRSALQTIEAVREIGGNVVGLGVLCNRGEVTAEEVGNPPYFTALVSPVIESWDLKDCPLCASGKQVDTRLGHGARFLANKS